MDYIRRNGVIQAYEWDGSQQSLDHIIKAMGLEKNVHIVVTNYYFNNEMNGRNIQVVIDHPSGYKEGLPLKENDYIFKDENGEIKIWNKGKFESTFKRPPLDPAQEIRKKMSSVKLDPKYVKSSQLLLQGQDDSTLCFAVDVTLRQKFCGSGSIKVIHWCIYNEDILLGEYTDERLAIGVRDKIYTKMKNLRFLYNNHRAVDSADVFYQLPKDIRVEELIL